MEKISPVDFEKKLTEFCAFYDGNHDFLSSGAGVFKTLISALLVDSIQVDSITSRIKDREECISKFKRKYLIDLEKQGIDYHIKDFLTDIVGLRIVCLHIDDIKKVQKLLEANFKEIDITDKSSQLDSTEDKFGYKGVHLDLMMNDQRSSLPEYSKFANIRFELQIRTIIQDAWSVLDHKIKYKKNIPIELKRRINRLSALFEVADEEFLRIKDETQKEKEKAQAEINEQSEERIETIDVFKFLSIVEPFFPAYSFIEYKADGFVGEILRADSSFSAEQLINALTKNKEKIERYSASTMSYMNPYTVIRHSIYLLNTDRYKTLLYDSQRMAYERWNDQK